jgi:hypothetical protein
MGTVIALSKSASVMDRLASMQYGELLPAPYQQHAFLGWTHNMTRILSVRTEYFGVADVRFASKSVSRDVDGMVPHIHEAESAALGVAQ